MTISEKIKLFRNMRGLSQAQLAQMINISAGDVAKYESGIRIPKMKLREEIARSLSVDPVEFMEDPLSEEDEIRLLQKLIVKYGEDISMDPSEKTVNVRFSEKIHPFAEVLMQYQSAIKGHSRDRLKDSIAFEHFKMFCWLESWPEYGKDSNGTRFNGDVHAFWRYVAEEVTNVDLTRLGFCPTNIEELMSAIKTE